MQDVDDPNSQKKSLTESFIIDAEVGAENLGELP